MFIPRIEDVTEVLDVNGDPIPLAWALEFGGHFMGDGCLFLSRHTRQPSGIWTYQPQARIGQRADSRPVLEVIQAKLGGHIRDYTGEHRTTRGKTYVCNPTCVWTTSSQPDMQRVIDLLGYLQFPYAKWAQVEVMREYLDFRAQFGVRYGDKARTQVELYYQQLRELKRYSSE